MGLWRLIKAKPIGTLIIIMEAIVDIYLWQTLAMKRPIDDAESAVIL